MKTASRLPAILIIICLLLALTACGGNMPYITSSSTAPPSEEVSASTVTPAPQTEPSVYNLGLLKGPTGMGGVYIMDNAESDLYIESDNIDYEITLASAPAELAALLINGELDIAAMATNVAASLYNKTEGEIQIIALNTMGVLYILENGNSVQSVSNLSGKTIYATGQGANPEYILNYILNSKELIPGKDVFIEWRDSDELSTLIASGGINLCMLPVPAATAVQMKNDSIRTALNISEEWSSLEHDSSLIMGCIVARRDFINDNPEAVNAFLRQYEESVFKANTNYDAAALMAHYEIVPNADIAKAAIPFANLCLISGADIRPAIEGYYEVLFAADPTSIGGSMPDEDFYYTFS